ncbi:MAG: Gfo/Idh/MocA family oxidoreductase [Anaerolineales bacterium]|nr:Gfo/Idh/MocA family oxidoreductase [Anaerolineales bacterium]
MADPVRLGVVGCGADDVDLVLVTTSMREHGMVTRAALEAGKHVLVEKPMSHTLEEAAATLEVARRSKGFLVPAPHVMLSPTYQKMWRHIHNGDIGAPYLARAFYNWAQAKLGQVVLRAGWRLDVRPRRLQHRESDRLSGAGQTRHWADRHGDQGAHRRQRDDDGADRRQRAPVH